MKLKKKRKESVEVKITPSKDFRIYAINENENYIYYIIP